MIIDFIRGFVENTPWWVWVILGMIIVRGIKSLREQRIYIPIMVAVPLIFIGIRIVVGFPCSTVAYYILGQVIGLIIGSNVAGFRYVTRKITFDKSKFQVILPGSPEILIISFSFFSLKYFFGFLEFIRPLLFAHYVWIDTLCTGLLVGYFLGQGLCYLRIYNHLK